LELLHCQDFFDNLALKSTCAVLSSDDHVMGITSEPQTQAHGRRASTRIPQRKSSRILADKTKNNHGKGAIEVAQDFVVKKLGHLFLQAGKQATNQFEFFA
jgi:hypothetical protein